jgi:DNA-binding response OmpR family regulator
LEDAVAHTLGTVLVAEEDKVLRRLVQLGLAQRRYRVLGACDGQQALSLARRHPGPIELLVTEVCLPRLSGPEVAENLAREHPEMEVLFLTDAPEPPEARRCLSAVRGRILQRPIDLPRLLSEVDEQLRARCARKPPARCEAAAAAAGSQRAG